MGLGGLRENQLVRWGDRLFKLMGRLPDGDWHMVDVTNGLMDKQPDTAIWAALERHELAFVDRDSAPSGKTADKLLSLVSNAAEACGISPDADDEKLKVAGLRWKYVLATRGLNLPETAAVIPDIWGKIGWPAEEPHRNTVWGWKRRCELASDPIAALMDHHEKKGRYGERYGPEVMEIIRHVRDEKYLKQNPRISIEAAVEKVKDRIVLQNARRPRSDPLPIAKRKAFERVLAEIPAEERCARRFGRDAAIARFRVSLGGVKADHPLSRCEVDHTPLAIVLADEDFVPWGRASASVALDVNLKMPTGTYWGAEVPSIVSLARCIRHSVCPKVEFLKKYPNVLGKWDLFGVAETYVLDDGLEEFAEGLRNACAQLGGATAEFCGRKRPWHKPHIERFFRSQDLGFLQRQPGATMENILKRCNFDPKKDLILRRSTFDKLYMKWLVDIYMNEPLEILGGQSPRQACASRISKVDQFVPSATVLLERLFLRKVSGRRLDHEGIEYDRLIYNSTDMGALRLQCGATLSVDIYVSDEDVGYIQVVVPNTDIWIRVPCLDLAYASGMTRWQHERCKKMKRVLRDEGRDLTLAEAREEIEMAIENEANEFRQSHRKRRSRFTERNEVHPQEEVGATAKHSAVTAHQGDIEGPHALARDECRRPIAQASFVLSTEES
jgi:putative transposase